MARFRVTAAPPAIHIEFDDGGMNLLSRDALGELAALLPRVRESTLMTFRSARPGLFAAGADMAEMRNFGPREAESFSAAGQDLFREIEKLRLVTVALIDGDCFGGALDLVLAFDVRLATRRSRFSHPGARLGIVTGFGGTSRWRGKIERAAANSLFLANTVASAEEAQQMGLVDHVFEKLGEADPELQRLAALDAKKTRLVKELALHGERLSQNQILLLAELLGKY